MPTDNIHAGHRQRMRKEFIEKGVESFSDVRALELLLFYAFAQKDTNPLAHALLDRFGSLQDVFQAPYDELCSVPGIGESAAVLIRLLPELQRKAKIDAERKAVKVMDSSFASGTIACSYLKDAMQENFMLFCLDAQKHLIRADTIAEGVVNRVDVDVRRVAELALRYRASCVVLAHNHPDGMLLPSQEDLTLTLTICEALSVLGIPVADHIIVSGNSYYSFADAGQI